MAAESGIGNGMEEENGVALRDDFNPSVLMEFLIIVRHETWYEFPTQAVYYCSANVDPTSKRLRRERREQMLPQFIFFFLSFYLTWGSVFAPVDGRRDEGVVVLVADDRDLVGGRLDDGARFGGVVVGRIEQVRR